MLGVRAPGRGSLIDSISVANQRETGPSSTHFQTEKVARHGSGKRRPDLRQCAGDHFLQIGSTRISVPAIIRICRSVHSHASGWTDGASTHRVIRKGQESILVGIEGIRIPTHACFCATGSRLNLN
jgi:hypothetical protein